MDHYSLCNWHITKKRRTRLCSMKIKLHKKCIQPRREAQTRERKRREREREQERTKLVQINKNEKKIRINRQQKNIEVNCAKSMKSIRILFGKNHTKNSSYAKSVRENYKPQWTLWWERACLGRLNYFHNVRIDTLAVGTTILLSIFLLSFLMLSRFTVFFIWFGFYAIFSSSFHFNLKSFPFFFIHSFIYCRTMCSGFVFNLKLA